MNKNISSNHYRKKIAAIIIVVLFLIIGIFVLYPTVNVTQNTQILPPTTVSQKIQKPITYKGENDVDALTLLKKQAAVGQDHSGLVVSINNVKPTGHDYWAFYINGKLAPIGPAEYKTKNGDIIMWKIEKY
jgi:hypothetical protein